ncbi:MAG: aminopeptidase [Erysipelotrichaceae bacterium]|nr:aminopeptidase [Erysipelotrichaceae bacterium]
MNTCFLEKYARVLVEVGVNLQKGQKLLLQCTSDSLDLARMISKVAFERGAADVAVFIDDPYIKRLRGLYCDEETVKEVPDYRKEQLDYYLRQDCVQMSLMGTYPHNMDGVSNENSIAIANADNEVRNVVRKYLHKGTLQWTGTAVPNLEWAKAVYPELSEDEALEKLENDICVMMRCDKDDPVEAWKKHCEDLSKVSTALNNYNFERLHIRSELGTDIEIKLVKDHIWTSAGDMGESLTKVPYVANMPTEEIFTDPHRMEVNGIAYASRPLMISGKLVKDFWIRFKDGLAVECGASQNKEVLENLLMKDEYTRRLGEVALVSKNSPITKMNRIYFNGLIDENAASHLAFGQSFSTNIKNGTDMTNEELLEAGVNNASCHCDFMIGTPEFEVVGIKYDGTRVQVMKEGDFVL